MRRLLVGLLMLGSIVLSANDAVAAPRQLEVVVMCQGIDGYPVVSVAYGPATDRFVQHAVTWVQSFPCEPGTISVSVRPVKP